MTPTNFRFTPLKTKYYATSPYSKQITGLLTSSSSTSSSSSSHAVKCYLVCCRPTDHRVPFLPQYGSSGLFLKFCSKARDETSCNYTHEIVLKNFQSLSCKKIQHCSTGSIFILPHLQTRLEQRKDGWTTVLCSLQTFPLDFELNQTLTLRRLMSYIYIYIHIYIYIYVWSTHS